jgi:hypothetical protein
MKTEGAPPGCREGARSSTTLGLDRFISCAGRNCTGTASLNRQRILATPPHGRPRAPDVVLSDSCSLVAEHTQRYVGQPLVTAGVLRNLPVSNQYKGCFTYWVGKEA